MTASVAPRRSTRLAASVAAATTFLLAACGSDGTSRIQIPDSPPELKGELTGIVYGPRAVVEAPIAAGRWWPSRLGLISTAYANLFNEIPFGIRGAHVTLSSLTEVDAADGRIDSYDPVVQSVPTDADGRYRIVHHFVETLEVCESINSDRFVGRLLVSVAVGDPNLRGDTRAFVVSTQTDVDASTEAVVRLVLERIHEHYPPVQLCDFDIEGLRNLVRVAQDAAYTARGDTVGEINADAYRLARENCKVLRALDQATGVPVEPPLPCVRG